MYVSVNSTLQQRWTGQSVKCSVGKALVPKGRAQEKKIENIFRGANHT